MERRSDIIPDGIAASTTDMVCSKFKSPICEANKKAINGKNANFMTEVKAIIDLDLRIAEKSIDKPKVIMIKGIAP